MRKASALLTLALPLFCSAADDSVLKFDPPAAGAKSQLRFEMTITLPANEGFLTAVSLMNISKVDSEKVDATNDWDKFKVTVDGNEMPVPFEPIKLSLGKDGDPTALSGGVEGSDARMYEFLWFPHPDKELKKGEATTFTLAAKKTLGLPERTVTETYEGQDTVNGKPANRVKVKIEEVKGDDFSLEGTFWVLNDGTIVKEDSTFNNLPIPQANNGIAKGTFKASVPSS